MNFMKCMMNILSVGSSTQLPLLFLPMITVSCGWNSTRTVEMWLNLHASLIVRGYTENAIQAAKKASYYMG